MQANEFEQGPAEAVSVFVEAFNNLDWEPFRNSFSDHATVFFPFSDTQRRLTGRAAIETRFKKFFDQERAANEGPPYLRINPQNIQIQQFDDTAIVTFHLRSGPPLNRRTLVLSRHSGRWLIEHLHASVMSGPGSE